VRAAEVIDPEGELEVFQVGEIHGEVQLWLLQEIRKVPEHQMGQFFVLEQSRRKLAVVHRSVGGLVNDQLADIGPFETLDQFLHVRVVKVPLDLKVEKVHRFWVCIDEGVKLAGIVPCVEVDVDVMVAAAVDLSMFLDEFDKCLGADVEVRLLSWRSFVIIG